MIDETKNGEISVEALKAGDQVEYVRFVDQFSGPIYRLALKTLNDPLDAEDVLQETFIKAFKHIPEFEGRSSLSTWLYRIAMNEALMLIRKRQPQALSIDQEMESDDGPQEPLEIVDWQPLPEEVLIGNETAMVMDRAIQDLPETLRVVFLLRDIEGLSIRETAQVLDLSEQAVKTRLLRARLHLRNLLSVYFRERMAEK